MRDIPKAGLRMFEAPRSLDLTVWGQPRGNDEECVVEKAMSPLCFGRKIHYGGCDIRSLSLLYVWSFVLFIPSHILFSALSTFFASFSIPSWFCELTLFCSLHSLHFTTLQSLGRSLLYEFLYLTILFRTIPTRIMKTSATLSLFALLAIANARPTNVQKREVPQEHAHQRILTAVKVSLDLNNPAGIADPIFGLLGNGAAAAGAGKITNLDCLHQ